MQYIWTDVKCMLKHPFHSNVYTIACNFNFMCENDDYCFCLKQFVLKFSKQIDNICGLSPPSMLTISPKQTPHTKQNKLSSFVPMAYAISPNRFKMFLHTSAQSMGQQPPFRGAFPAAARPPFSLFAKEISLPHLNRFYKLCKLFHFKNSSICCAVCVCVVSVVVAVPA